MLQGVCVVHVDAPGHEDDAGLLASDALRREPLSMESLAQQLGVVCAQLELPRFIGLGMGAGANVLLRYASDHPRNLAGLILMNPTLKGPTRCESLYLAYASLLVRLQHRADAISILARIHFSGRALACKSLPRAYTRSHKVPASVDNKLWFLRAWRERDALGPARLKALRDVPMLCFSAYESAGMMLVPNTYPEEDCDSLIEELICEGLHTRVSHIRVRGCGNQLAEERAEECLVPMRLFAAGIRLQLGR